MREEGRVREGSCGRLEDGSMFKCSWTGATGWVNMNLCRRKKVSGLGAAGALPHDERKRRERRASEKLGSVVVGKRSGGSIWTSGHLAVPNAGTSDMP